MPTCFVIQPFDNGPFDKRYDDVLAPAIAEAGLSPYRVDRDPSTSIPIEDIEQEIRKASVCLADISTTNPNVWFELGYAIARGKPMVLVCSHEPERRFPFDIQHRTIVSYRTESASDFSKLKKDITARLTAALDKAETIRNLSKSAVVADIEGLNNIESITLVTIAANVGSPDGSASSWRIAQDMEKAGYTSLASTLGLSSLLQKNMVKNELISDWDGDEYTAYQIMPNGFKWLLNNQDRLILRNPNGSATEEAIPF